MANFPVILANFPLVLAGFWLEIHGFWLEIHGWLARTKYPWVVDPYQIPVGGWPGPKVRHVGGPVPNNGVLLAWSQITVFCWPGPKVCCVGGPVLKYVVLVARSQIQCFVGPVPIQCFVGPVPKYAMWVARSQSTQCGWPGPNARWSVSQCTGGRCPNARVDGWTGEYPGYAVYGTHGVYTCPFTGLVHPLAGTPSTVHPLPRRSPGTPTPDPRTKCAHQA